MTYKRPGADGLCVGTHRHDSERPRLSLEGVHLCSGCYDHAERLLAHLPMLCDDLERAMLRSGSSGPKISGNPEKALPYDDKAGDARRALLEFVTSWTLLIAEERGMHIPADHTPTGLTIWHRQQLPWIAAQPWIDEYLTNLRADSSAGRAVLAGQRMKRLPLGACPDTDRCDVDSHAEQRCTGKVIATVDTSDDLAPAVVRCDTCGREHEAHQLSTLGKRITGSTVWLTTPQAAAVLGLSRDATRVRALKEHWRCQDPQARPGRWNADDVEASRLRHEKVSA